jgi:hypothetical protein
MKYYDLDSVFSFGKFKGLSLSQVLLVQTSYVNWCLENLDHFYISMEDQVAIKALHNEFVLNEDKMGLEAEDYDDYNDYEQDSYEDFTDWSHYNDALDMDQQSIEFWNQF